MSRSAGRALLVGSAACRSHARAALLRSPFEIAQADDPYAAALELCRRPLAYRVVVLCLHSTYREELSLIAMVRQRLKHIDVYLSQTDGRQAALAEGMRLGAAGLLAEDGLHRIASDAFTGAALNEVATQQTALEQPSTDGDMQGFSDDSISSGEAVLTADELRALLQDQPSLPPSTGQ